MTERVRATSASCRSILRAAGVPASVYTMWGINLVKTSRAEDAARALRLAGLVADVEDEQVWVFSPS